MEPYIAKRSIIKYTNFWIYWYFPNCLWCITVMKYKAFWILLILKFWKSLKNIFLSPLDLNQNRGTKTFTKIVPVYAKKKIILKKIIIWTMVNDDEETVLTIFEKKKNILKYNKIIKILYESKWKYLNTFKDHNFLVKYILWWHFLNC